LFHYPTWSVDAVSRSALAAIALKTISIASVFRELLKFEHPEGSFLKRSAVEGRMNSKKIRDEWVGRPMVSRNQLNS
jgi:hypothetical protein